MMKKLLGIFLIIFMATSVFITEESEFEKTKRINEEKVKALRAHWKAEQGDAEAQYELGTLYDKRARCRTGLQTSIPLV